MATLRKRKTSNGFSYQVRWRDRDNDGEETSKTFDILREATLFKDFLNSNNQSLDYATVSIQADTLENYRNIANRHINPTLGNIPIDQFSVEDVQDWFKNLKRSAKTKKKYSSPFIFCHKNRNS